MTAIDVELGDLGGDGSENEDGHLELSAEQSVIPDSSLLEMFQLIDALKSKFLEQGFDLNQVLSELFVTKESLILLVFYFQPDESFAALKTSSQSLFEILEKTIESVRGDNTLVRNLFLRSHE